MAKAKRLTKAESLAVETGMFCGYDVAWLRKLRADGEPHPDGDRLIEEYDALVARAEGVKPEVEDQPLDNEENIEN